MANFETNFRLISSFSKINILVKKQIEEETNICKENWMQRVDQIVTINTSSKNSLFAHKKPTYARHDHFKETPS